jgi:hypothetical protein
MKRNVIGLAAAFLLAALPAYATNPPSVRWTRTFAGWGTASGRCVQQTADGGYIAVGRTFSRDSATRLAALLVKLDASGNTQWTKAIKAEGGMTAFSVVQTSDGGYIVAAATSDACLVRTDTSGNELWRSYLANDFSTGARSLVRLGDTAYTAVVQRGLGDSAVILWRTDSGGNSRGTSKYNLVYGLGPTDEDLSLRRTSDGGYIIGTKTLLKVDSLGLQPSLKTFGSVMSANSVIQTSDGGYAATGAKLDYASIYLLKTNANRDSAWMGTYVPSQCSRGKWVEQTTDGGYIIAGTTRPSNQHDKVTLVKTLPDGSLDWTDTLFGGLGCCVRQTADGGYVVAGMSGGRLFVTKLAAEARKQR